MNTTHIPVVKQKPENSQKNSKIFPMCNHTLHFDGCSKGNPGPAGIGAVIYENNEEIWGGSQYLGNSKTNNQAEYAALILGLNQAIDLDIDNLLVFGDSQLVIHQINKVYKVKNKELLNLYSEVCELTTHFKYIEFIHLYRNKNKRADQLANLAMEKFNIQLEKY
jgi:ribonuclease HI